MPSYLVLSLSSLFHSALQNFEQSFLHLQTLGIFIPQLNKAILQDSGIANSQKPSTMAKRYTPAEVKDFCIKARMRQHGYDLFIPHKDPMDFMSMASFNYAAINDSDPFSTQLEPPEDFDSFLSNHLEGQRLATNEVYLKLLKLPGMLEAVDTLMNEELLSFDQKISPKKIDAIMISHKVF